MKKVPSDITSPARPATPPFSLSNTHGFWELTFYGHQAVIPQHQALFFVAFLLSTPNARSIPAPELAADVLNQFGGHPDFIQTSPLNLYPPDTRRALYSIISHRVESLHAALEVPGESEPVKADITREIARLYNLESTLLTEFTAAETAAGSFITDIIHNLYLALAQARTPQRLPHSLLRRYSRHLFLYLILPSARATHSAAVPTFTYTPPPSIRWSIDVDFPP